MGREYWTALDKARATEDWTARTLSALEAAEVAPHRRRGRGALRMLAAAAVCGALLATAVAVSPGLRETLLDALGAFAPYAAEPEGVADADRGIEVRAVSALSDGNVARFYLSVQDKTGDRLGEQTIISSIRMDRPDADYAAGGYSNGYQVSYDPETRTALYALRFTGDGPPAQGGALEVEIGGFQPREWRSNGTIPQGLLTGDTLETDTLETGYVVLIPEQTPGEIEDADGITLSSLGFGSDGLLHVQFRLEDRLDPARTSVYAKLESRSTTPEQHDRRDRYILSPKGREDGVRFEYKGHSYIDWVHQVYPSDLEDVVVEKVRLIAIQGEEIEGTWKLSIPLEDVPHRRFDLDERIGLVTVRSLDLTPLGLSTESDPGDGPGTLAYPAAVILTDGTVVEAGEMPDSGYHANGYTFSHWSFDEPVDPETVAGVAFGHWYIPIVGETAGPGYWLEELPGA